MGSPCDIIKRREIEFHRFPPGQVESAYVFLRQLPNLNVRRAAPLRVEVRYCIQDYTLEAIEKALAGIGCHLEATLLTRIKRALYYYVEGIQRDNLEQPEIHTKDYSLANAEVWVARPHGDHDPTPTEWRQYK